MYKLPTIALAALIIAFGVNMQSASANIHTYDCAAEIAKTEKLLNNANMPRQKRDKAEASLRHGMKLFKKGKEKGCKKQVDIVRQNYL